MQSTSLYDLNEYLKRVVALNFNEPVWVSCEISQVSEVRGQVYLDVIQQNENTDEVVAQSSAVIWYKQYLFIKKKLNDLLPSILKVGTHVLLKVMVEYHERYGVKLVVEDIDPSYTIGHMEMARQKILQRLIEADIIDLNRQTSLPRVINNIAIISSNTAAGYKDFTAQLDNNEYGYKFTATLYKAAMQGQNTEREVCQALDAISKSDVKYHCVVIIRGGGSKLDLSAFDSYNIGFKVANYDIPVITGIGHEIDQNVVDIVSHTSLKTPTAVASYIIDHNANFEAEVLQLGHWIGLKAKEYISTNNSLLGQMEQLVKLTPKTILQSSLKTLESLNDQLIQASKYKLKAIDEKLKYLEKLIKMVDPQMILKRGYSITKVNSKTISSSNQLKTGDNITISFYDGDKQAVIKQ